MHQVDSMKTMYQYVIEWISIRNTIANFTESEYDQKECFVHHAWGFLFNYDCDSYVPKTSSKPEWPARSRNGDKASRNHARLEGIKYSTLAREN